MHRGGGPHLGGEIDSLRNNSSTSSPRAWPQGFDGDPETDLGFRPLLWCLGLNLGFGSRFERAAFWPGGLLDIVLALVDGDGPCAVAPEWQIVAPLAYG